MRTIETAFRVVAGAGVACSIAVAGPAPVALVENVSGNPAGIELMDYVEIGKVIELGARDAIVLSYMQSCVRETITGGTVTVGADQSNVHGGKVARAKVPCEAGKMLLATNEAAQFGGKIFRGSPATADVSQGPQFTLYGRSPIVEVSAPGRLIIERMDQPGERHVVNVETGALVHGRFYDFAKQGPRLAAGGTYRASLGNQEIIFRIDGSAKAGNTPLLGRLVRFTSPG
jgi:hypothetical protein